MGKERGKRGEIRGKGGEKRGKRGVKWGTRKGKENNGIITVGGGLGEIMIKEGL